MDWLETNGIIVDRPGALNRVGNIKTTCPRCHRKNALSVHMTKKLWHCHYAGCGWSGSAEHAGVDFSRVAKDTTPKAMIPEDMPDTYTPPSEWRGIPSSILQVYGVGFSDENEPIFQYTFNGMVTNTKRRYTDASGKKGFDVKGGSILIPFGYDQAMKQLAELTNGDRMMLVLTEGEVDAMSCVRAGYAAISMPNGANKNLDWAINAEPLLRSDSVEIILAVDSDPAGAAIEATLANMFGKHRCWRVDYLNGCKDANEVLLNYSVDDLNRMLMAAEPYPIDGIITPQSIYRDLERLYYDGGSLSSQSTGFAFLDELWTFAEGQTTLFYGVPGAGKSEFVDNLIVNLARKYNYRAAVFSPEYFPPERYMAKWIEKYSGGNFFYGQGRVTERDLPGYARWVNNHMNIVIPDTFTIDAILELATIEAYRNQIKILLIDNWSAIMQDNDRITETKWIGEELTKCQNWGRNHGCAVFIVNHPTKMQRIPGTNNYIKPRPYDMSGSAQWYNKADSILMIDRDRDDERNPVSVEVQKIRYKEVGQEGTAYFTFNRYNSTYTSIGAKTRSGEQLGPTPVFYSQPKMEFS